MIRIVLITTYNPKTYMVNPFGVKKSVNPLQNNKSLTLYGYKFNWNVNCFQANPYMASKAL